MRGALEELPGVLEVQVRLRTRDAQVTFRPGVVTVDAMQRAVERVDLRHAMRHRLLGWVGVLRGRRPW